MILGLIARADRVQRVDDCMHWDSSYFAEDAEASTRGSLYSVPSKRAHAQYYYTAYIYRDAVSSQVHHTCSIRIYYLYPRELEPRHDWHKATNSTYILRSRVRGVLTDDNLASY